MPLDAFLRDFVDGAVAWPAAFNAGMLALLFTGMAAALLHPWEPER